MSRDYDGTVPKALRAGLASSCRPSIVPVPRLPRLQVAGGVYHVTSRGNRRQTVFHDDTDYSAFIEYLETVVQQYSWRCHGYCLMPNHFHLLIETPEPNISEGMQRLNSRYAQWFNRRHGYSGHLFQGRFYGRLVESAYHLLELARYVVANPVRAGLCSHAGEWKWSSYRAVVGDVKRATFLAVGWLLDQFGRDPQQARETFRQFVRDASARPRAP
jgi:putative transposase